MSSLLQPEERVLSTLNADGSRRWLDPKPVTGFFRSRRLLVAWILIAIFNVLPHLRADGRQLFQMNVAAGEFNFFGFTLIRTDTLVFALAALTIIVSVFLATAMFGRVWCGWGCPQTVYMEFLFRPIARLFDGKGKAGLRGALSRLPNAPRQILRWAFFGLICFHLANTFLAYFVGAQTVYSWSLQPPWIHPVGFVFVLFVTAAMLADFGFFREQVCFVVCPYGRFQSVLLDRQSLIVGYDARRGEPRGPVKKSKNTQADLSLKIVESDAAASETGDCVDCNRCVQVCPTGIDIRDGLQMECIHCARCIDACDTVMDKLGRDPGLIRYSSQSVLEGERSRFFRPRMAVYPAILAVLITSLLVLTTSRASADLRFIRDVGQPFYVLPSGEVTNQIRLRITNRASEPATFTVASENDAVRLETQDDAANLAPGETRSLRLRVFAEAGVFAAGRGSYEAQLTVKSDNDFEQTRTVRLLGPISGSVPTEGATPDAP
ncbi:MAG: cytochrome c oxidase accessory protein CcoG [Planctomycetota bacterium]